MRDLFADRRAPLSAARELSGLAKVLCIGVVAMATPLTSASARDGADTPGVTAAERDMLERARRDQRSPLEAQRTEELDKLSEKLRRAREGRAEKLGGGAGPWVTEVKPEPLKSDLDRTSRRALGAGGSVVAARDLGRATLLMVMTPGTRGIRRFDAVADPVLCTDDGCYVSQGPLAPAEMRGRSGVLGVQNTFGARAGACRNQLGCVFRDIEIGSGSKLIAPIDLRVLRHDRRPTAVVALDESCKVALDRLVCNRPFVGDGYTVWVVPEAVAREAGSERLQRAVDTGLRR